MTDEKTDPEGRSLSECDLTRDTFEAETLDASADGIAPGMVIGGRYRIQKLLGRGGMGEVWHAYDLKLQVEVALKTALERLGPRASELTRREVRAAREVLSPNVCRIHDLIEIDGRELVSMEFVDGTTLREVLVRQSPLELGEASDIASQLLAGLAAIHEAGLVHRDFKPENIMITRSRRVLVMDLGLARPSLPEGTVSVSGTPAYMPPEQARGDPAESSIDVFAAGVVLAEMVNPPGVCSLDRLKELWSAVRHSPPELAQTPWRAVLVRALSADPAKRYRSARELARALERATLRVEQAEDRTPYPGLASFTEDDAEFFFGREAEVESTWKRLARAPMVAVIGASGAGKSSFLRAGLIPARPEGWGHVLFKPGGEPFASLGRALIPELANDAEWLQKIFRIEEPGVAAELIARWAGRHEQAVLFIDQFEELFALNPPEVQSRLASLLGEISVRSGEVRVLIAIRDDFLIHCHAYPPLATLFSELVPVGAPGGDALRRAVVQPALRCGYRFESEELVDEMLAAVAEERAALPLLAFAVARLWEFRDRESGLLTAQSYRSIGGVTGALVEHAETTLEGVGPGQRSVVRELFRSLTTSQGTRVSLPAAQLVSMFEGDDQGEREAAERVLNQLIEARLLTQFDAPGGSGEDDAETRRIEIVHESLLTSWPRLVRWRSQDTEGAQLRDELRQTAERWAARGRPDDLLWSGSYLQQFELWRRREIVPLTAEEESFASAMTERSRRKRRRKTLALGAVMASLLAFAATVTILWQRSDAARMHAEASQLTMLGRGALQNDPSTALAYAIAALERNDGPSVRRFALEVLWSGPTMLRAHSEPFGGLSGAFSPDGQWFATGSERGRVELWPRRGGAPSLLRGQQGAVSLLAFSSRSDLLISHSSADGRVAIWSVSNGELVASETAPADAIVMVATNQPRVFALTGDTEGSVVWAWAFDESGWQELGRTATVSSAAVNAAGSRLLVASASRVSLLAVEDLAAPILLGETREPVRRVALDPRGRLVASADESGEVLVWSVQGGATELVRAYRHRGVINSLHFDEIGATLAAAGMDKTASLWTLALPETADPLRLRRGNVLQLSGAFLDPQAHWVATIDPVDVALWHLDWPHETVLRGHEARVTAVDFAPDGSWLASASSDGTVRLWPAGVANAVESRVLYRDEEVEFVGLDVHPDGHSVVAVGSEGRVAVIPTDGGPALLLEGFRSQVYAVAVDPAGRRVAGSGGQLDPSEAVIRVWELDGSGVRVLDPGDGKLITDIAFTPDGRLASGGLGGLRVWNVDDGGTRILTEEPTLFLDLSADGKIMLAASMTSIQVRDLEQDSSRRLASHGTVGRPSVVSIARDGSLIASGEFDGTVRVGPADGGTPSLLLGHSGTIYSVAIDPTGRWVATGADDGSVRLWPIPRDPPLQTLPLDQLLARLYAMTNLRVAASGESDGGYQIESRPLERPFAAP